MLVGQPVCEQTNLNLKQEKFLVAADVLRITALNPDI